MVSEERAGFNRLFGQAALKNEKEIEASGIANIEIDYSSQDVIVYAGEPGRILIKEFLRDSTENASVTVNGDTLSCRAGKSYPSFFMTNRWEKIEIYLPPDYAGRLSIQTSSGDIRTDAHWDLLEFEAQASSGDIRIKEVTAQTIKAETSSGDIRFEKAGGECEMTASSGDITVLSGKGGGSFETSSGDITVKGIAGKLEAEASSGDIELEAEELSGDMEVNTTSGDMKILLPADSSFDYQGSSNSGDISTSFDDSLNYNKKGNRAEGTWGNGPAVKVRTSASSGDTRIAWIRK